MYACQEACAVDSMRCSIILDQTFRCVLLILHRQQHVHLRGDVGCEIHATSLRFAASTHTGARAGERGGRDGNPRVRLLRHRRLQRRVAARRDSARGRCAAGCGERFGIALLGSGDWVKHAGRMMEVSAAAVACSDTIARGLEHSQAVGTISGEPNNLRGLPNPGHLLSAAGAAAAPARGLQQPPPPPPQKPLLRPAVSYTETASESAGELAALQGRRRRRRPAKPCRGILTSGWRQRLLCSDPAAANRPRCSPFTAAKKR